MLRGRTLNVLNFTRVCQCNDGLRKAKERRWCGVIRVQQLIVRSSLHAREILPCANKELVHVNSTADHCIVLLLCLRMSESLDQRLKQSVCRLSRWHQPSL